jgi:hypothetical protein
VWTINEKGIVRIDRSTGRREAIGTYGSGRPQQVVFSGPLVFSADGQAYAYTYGTVTSDLYVVDGAR